LSQRYLRLLDEPLTPSALRAEGIVCGESSAR
jgi:hypothetical protein